jgi:hypothetical protein
VTIAFDFDGTITADPATMIAAMRLFRDAGWTVIVATLRGEHERNDAVQRLLAGEFPVVYSNCKVKQSACRAAGYTVNVWVDDTPQLCCETLLVGVDKEL